MATADETAKAFGLPGAPAVAPQHHLAATVPAAYPSTQNATHTHPASHRDDRSPSPGN